MESNTTITVQRLRKTLPDSFSLAEKYYSLLSDVNNLNLTKREIQLVAFTAIKGNISNGGVREEFCKKFKTTEPTINNIISKLKKMGVFVKVGGEISITAPIKLDFNKDVVLQITLGHDSKR